MKILQINVTEGVGSTGRIVSGIQNVLENESEECLVAYGRETNKSLNNIKIGNKKDIYLHVLKTRVFDRHGFGSKNSTKKLIKQIKGINPDIIHLQNIHGYFVNIEILFNFIKSIDIPVIWSLHDCWSFTGHCSHFEYVDCDRWKTGCHNCPEKNSYPKSVFLDNSKKNYIDKKRLFTGIKNLTIIVGSKWIDNLIKQSFLKDYNTVLIPTGIDLDMFKPTKSNFREKYNIENKYIILGVASIWSERKGIEYFKKLSYNLNSDEIIILVGIKEKQKKGLPKNIIAIDKTNSIKELAEIYTAANVFVNPTLEDTFPTTNIEAQACGTPVITFNTGGSPESIVQGTGFVVEQENLEELIEKIQLIKTIGKENLYKNCIENSKKYNMKHKYIEHYELYKDLIG